MPTKGDDLTLHKRLELLDEHDKRLESVEGQIKELKENAVKLEAVVTLENRETRAIMTQQTDKLFGLVKEAMGFKTESASQQHELKMLRWNTLSNIFLKVSGGILGLLSSGGVIYYLIQYVTEN